MTQRALSYERNSCQRIPDASFLRMIDPLAELIQRKIAADFSRPVPREDASKATALGIQDGQRDRLFTRVAKKLYGTVGPLFES